MMDTLFPLDTAPATDLVVRRNDPVYNAHAYLTKVPVTAIAPFIEEFTEPGDTVLDPFAGSGMTGVAAAMLGRSARLSDISVLGRHVGSNYIQLVDPGDLRDAAGRVVEQALARVGKDPYGVECQACGASATVVKTIWSVCHDCSGCGQRFSYYAALERNDWKKHDLRCPACDAPFSARGATRTEERAMVDSVSCGCTRTQREQLPTDAPELDPHDLDVWIPKTSISSDREMYMRSALAKHGLTEVTSFFSARNLTVLAGLREAIQAVEPPVLREKLMFAFTAILPRASKRYQWSRQRPLNAATQVYYIAPVFYEWNVVDLFIRKVDAVVRSDQFIRNAMARHQRPVDVRYELASATALRATADESVDYVFTDPPFGSNIFYSDMNLFYEAWLGELTRAELEAVVHTTGQRGKAAADRYEDLLGNAFRECRRVLKPSGWMTVVFSNTSGAMWALLQRALAGSGFRIHRDRIRLLDKGQRSVKGLASGFEGVVTCDLMLSMQKTSDSSLPAPVSSPDSLLDTVAQVVTGPKFSVMESPSRVYVAMVRRYLENNWSLEDLDLAAAMEAMRELGFKQDPKTGRFAASA
jgi:16S rRNA G966 N2-methylase RsmD